MNTHSKKRGIVIDPGHQQNLGQGPIDSQQYFFTLPNMLDDNSFLHMAQFDTALYDLQGLNQAGIEAHKERKRQYARSLAEKREKKRMEKVVRLKRELIRKGELGESGLVWRNQERRQRGVQRIKKEEPSSPVLKVETPPTPNLLYPPTPPHRYKSMPLSRYQSLDPNDFVWSPRYAPSPI
jgi:hypothetical protein